MCIDWASEESLSCNENISFWPEKTAAILNYPQKLKGLLKKGTLIYIFISFNQKWIQNPPFVIAPQKGISNPWNSLINAFGPNIKIVRAVEPL